MAERQRGRAVTLAEGVRMALQAPPATDDSTLVGGDEVLTDVDEPPDCQQTPRATTSRLPPLATDGFGKSLPPQPQRRQSLLTQAFHNTGPDSQQDSDASQQDSRGLSCASAYSSISISVASTAELTSDGGVTSPDTRASSPSPPFPSSNLPIPPVFNTKSFAQGVRIRHDYEHEAVGPLQRLPPNESTVEAGLGRKRCITFACSSTQAAKQGPSKADAAPAPASPVEGNDPPKRLCTIKFACPARPTMEKSLHGRNRFPRPMSPAPSAGRAAGSPRPSPRSHRDSDSTVRNESPRRLRKPAPLRRFRENPDLGRTEATRFYEFADSEDELDEWVQQQGCYRSRLTISDTLRVENDLRQLGEEAEEEAMQEDDDDEAEDDDDDDDDDESEDEDAAAQADLKKYFQYESSDDGFRTDDEGGFASSDSESDGDPEDRWWAPAISTAATSVEPVEHIRPKTQRTYSNSSIGSNVSGNRSLHSFRSSMPGRRRPVKIRPRSPELPDSTDFVCGTLDEDRPLEDAYMECLERRRAAKHKATPQDIDPTFPTSDPEMDEEDECDANSTLAEESDAHILLHGQLDQIDGPHRKVSPRPSPRRMRSPPPPAKRAVQRSPPPRRRRSPPPPPLRLRSPPPAARFLRNHAKSLPRTPIHDASDEVDDDDDELPDPPARGAIDIRAGLEMKRRRRREKLYQKHCRKAGKEKDRRPAPGRGVERMKELGLELQAYRGKQAFDTNQSQDAHILSY